MRAFVLFVVLSGLAPLTSSDQSLVEIARQEEARRKAVKAPAKVYTNADLKNEPSKQPAPASPADAAAAAPLPPSAQVPVVNLPGPTVADAGPAARKLAEGSKPAKAGQAYWRERIDTARANLDRSRVLADALQSRLNALATDIINRDDPAQRAQLILERQRATLELERVTKEIDELTKAIADIEEEARKAGVPPGWLR
jgi:hypothetical protein